MNSMITRLATSLFLILIIFFIIYSRNIWIFSLAISLVCLLGMFEWVKNKFKNLFLGLFIIFNFGLCSILYVLLNENVYVLYGLIIINTAIFDTFAYVVGSKFGANFIVKKISPNKTLEGLVGGVIGSAIFGLMLGHLYEINFIALIFVLGAFLAFMGDLFISYFKRQSGVKDTGSILPGHGGILDRIDSHLIATPILILFL
tara:strand:- start:422 stop:1027 length:606 start_codon:yes stop_codon:yes gene_type:complete